MFRYIVKCLDYIEMNYDQRLHDQNDKRNEEKTISVDEDVFFREATLRITTILSADVEGYSRLMQKDEVGTIQILSAYKEVMANLMRHHHGRVEG